MIWRCPRCGDAVAGPSRPRPSDPCRLCSRCTLAAGALQFRRKTREKAQAAKMQAPAQVFKGADLDAELARLLPFCPDRIVRRPPTLVVEHRPKAPRYVAWAHWARNRIRILVWPRCSLAYTLASLVHELAHFCAYPKDEDHGDLFRMWMLELCRDGYGVDPAPPANRTLKAFDNSIKLAIEGTIHAGHRAAAD